MQLLTFKQIIVFSNYIARQSKLSKLIGVFNHHKSKPKLFTSRHKKKTPGFFSGKNKLEFVSNYLSQYLFISSHLSHKVQMHISLSVKKKYHLITIAVAIY